MSTATPVPETWELTGDDAWDAAADRRRRLLPDAFMRLRVADGFSHARSLAYMTSLVLVQAIIALVGLATRARHTACQRGDRERDPQALLPARPASPHHRGRARRTGRRVARYVRSLSARRRARHGARPHRSARAGPQPHLRRRAGPPDRRSTASPSCWPSPPARCRRSPSSPWASAQRSATRSTTTPWTTSWSVLRWPLALVLMIAAMTLLFRWCPRRHQPESSWLVFGAAVSVLLWFVVTLGLGLVLPISRSFGETYGPLAGIVALLLWALLSAIALLFGGAVAAQLEAVRAGAQRRRTPRRSTTPSPRRADLERRRAGVTPCGRDMRRRCGTWGPGRPRPTHLEGVIGVPATEGNRIDVLRNGDEIFPAMLDAIDGAEHTIDFLTFVYWEGRDRHRLRPAARGAGERRRAGAGAARRARCPHRSTARSIAHGAARVCRCAGSGRCGVPAGSVNHRTHRKVLIVDEAVGFTGGVGIADEWHGDARNENEWRDTHFRIAGPAVDGLRAAFLDNWAETDPVLFDEDVDRFPDQPKPGDAVVQCVRGASETGWSDVSTLFRTLLQLAKQRIRIATAYFVPDAELIERLCDAADRGVEVQILLPGPHADKRFVQLAGEAEYAELLDAGVEIWKFQPSMLHAKIMTVDGSSPTSARPTSTPARSRSTKRSTRRDRPELTAAARRALRRRPRAQRRIEARAVGAAAVGSGPPSASSPPSNVGSDADAHGPHLRVSSLRSRRAPTR